jgi:hypothetical protein
MEITPQSEFRRMIREDPDVLYKSLILINAPRFTGRHLIILDYLKQFIQRPYKLTFVPPTINQFCRGYRQMLCEEKRYDDHFTIVSKRITESTTSTTYQIPDSTIEFTLCLIVVLDHTRGIPRADLTIIHNLNAYPVVEVQQILMPCIVSVNRTIITYDDKDLRKELKQMVDYLKHEDDALVYDYDEFISNLETASSKALDTDS